MSYPKRNLSLNGLYVVTEDSFDSDISFKWNENPTSSYGYGYSEEVNEEDEEEKEKRKRVVGAALHWRNEPLVGLDKANQSATLSIRHPSFSKDVTFKGSYYRSPIELFQTMFTIDYCDEPDHFFSLYGAVKDLTSIVGFRNYTVEILTLHAASDLNLHSNTSLGIRPRFYEILSDGGYKHGYLPLQEGSLVAYINLDKNEVNYYVCIHLILILGAKVNKYFLFILQSFLTAKELKQFVSLHSFNGLTERNVKFTKQNFCFHLNKFIFHTFYEPLKGYFVPVVIVFLQN